MAENENKTPTSVEEIDIDKTINDLVSDVNLEPTLAPENSSEVTQQTPPATPPANIQGASVAIAVQTQGGTGPLEVQATKTIVIPDKKEILKEDPLIKGILNEEGTFDLLDIVLGELAEESASLKYERIKKELKDEETDRLSLRRSNILKMISDALVQKRNLALNDFVNLRSPQWQIVFDQLMKRIRKTFIDLQYSTEELELFFQKLQSNLEGFEEMAELKMKESFSRPEG